MKEFMVTHNGFFSVMDCCTFCSFFWLDKSDVSSLDNYSFFHRGRVALYSDSSEDLIIKKVEPGGFKPLFYDSNVNSVDESDPSYIYEEPDQPLEWRVLLSLLGLPFAKRSGVIK